VRKPNGHSLLELLIGIVILGLIVLVAVPAFATYRRRNSVVAAAHELEGTLRLVRSRAIARSAHAGIKFTQRGSTWWFAIYDDADHDGVRNDDIRNGVDVLAGRPSPLMPQLHAARVGLLPYAIKDPDGDPLPPTKPAVEFNNSAICSFSPIGSGTPGTIYVTDDAGELYCIRVLGDSGRVRILYYNATRRKWESR
jgi:type II secretory pathway pseudopilin PulG